MAVVGELQSASKPWDVFDWGPEQKQSIYRDWGLNYARLHRYENAIRNLNLSLELKPDDPNVLYNLSKCKRNMADPQGALEYGLAAAKLLETMTSHYHSDPIYLEICDALYELNDFEACSLKVNQKRRGSTNQKMTGFKSRMNALECNFQASIGESLSPFLTKNEQYFLQVSQIMKSQNLIDSRPRWKIMKEQGKCDVVSVQEKEDEVLSPLEKARRLRHFQIFTSNYMDRSWKDVLFIKDLRRNSSLFLPISKNQHMMHKIVDTEYDMLRKFLKMLQTRSPLYNEKRIKFPNINMFLQKREDTLNRIRYQTRRNMMSVLRNITSYRKTGNITKMTKYIEEVMGNYTVLKTNRVMPWKYEFVNEVYNTLGLALADQYKVPSNFKKVSEENKMLALLQISDDKNKDRQLHFVFGDKSTYSEADAVDPKWTAYIKYVGRLENRMMHSTYSIEKCYLLYEIARSHFEQNRFDECCFTARKAVDESSECNSYLWAFLNTMLMCKSFATLRTLERGKVALDSALYYATKLRSPTLSSFVYICRRINMSELILKKRTQSLESVRRRKNDTITTFTEEN